MLTQLTDEQAVQLRPWAERWIRVGLSTEPADWPLAEEAVRRYYAVARLPPPKRFVRVSSPIVCTLAGSQAALLLARDAVDGAVHDAVHVAVHDAVHVAVHGAVRDTVDDAVHVAVDGAVGVAVDGAVRGAVGVAVDGVVRGAVNAAVGVVNDAVYGTVRDAVRNAVSDAVYGAVYGAVDGAVGDAVDSAVGDAVNATVCDAVDDAIGVAVCDAVGDAVGGLWWRYLGGQFWAAWPAAIGSFYREVCGLSIPSEPAEMLASSCGWVWPHREFVMISDRPDRLRRDEAGRLHAQDGPAIRWRDGWGVYCWHGTRIPAEWIEEKDRVDPRLALTHPNVEQRRCIAEIIGWDRVLQLLSPRVIQQDPDPHMGTLLEVDLPDSGRERFVRVLCGTGRTFVIPVPPETQTAREGCAWTYGLTADEYAPEVRT